MKKYICFILILVLRISGNLHAQCNSTLACNGNTYVQSNDPNTIEYDNMVSTFHSSIAKEASGKLLVWGENIAANGRSHILSPVELNANNYPGLTGDILKFTGGSSSISTGQFMVLTTDGLFVWGLQGSLINSTITNSTTFGKVNIGTFGVPGNKADGLPQGVSPIDVKMMFGSYRTLALTTCSGKVWILSQIGNKNSDGTNDNSINSRVWHQVKTGAGANDFLTNVVAVRGTQNALIALTSTRKIYTWGRSTFLGNNSAPTNRLYATEMTLPSDWPTNAIPKMIGMTPSDGNSNTYYLLASNGILFSLGANSRRQLGNFTTGEQRTWGKVKKSNTENMTDISWISPQEHDNLYPAINALTTTGKLYAWGRNQGSMLGTSGAAIYPTYMPGGLASDDTLMAVETGGHTTIVVKQCNQNFGYVGHRVNGSMGNGSSSDSGAVNMYSFSTSKLNLCGANTSPNVISIKSCLGVAVDLTNAHIGSVPTGSQLKWYTTSTRNTGTEVANPSTVGPGTYYAFYIQTAGSCNNAPASEPVVISNLASGDPGYEDCTCKKPIKRGIHLSTQFGISTKQDPSVTNWPTSVPNGHIVLDASKKGMVITHMTTAQVNALIPVTGMIVYDTNAKCVKLYRGNTPVKAPNRKGWVCINKGCN